MDNISYSAKQWIEENIRYIDELDLTNKEESIKNLLKKVPSKIAAEVRDILVAVDLNISERSDIMYGIKTVPLPGGVTRLYRSDLMVQILAIIGYDAASNKFEANFYYSDAMRGGKQVAFKSLKAAEDALRKLAGVLSNYKIYVLNKSTVDKYLWREVDSDIGKIWITQDMWDYYTPDSKKLRRLTNKANKEILAAETDWIQSNIDADTIKRYILDNFGESSDKYYPIKVELDGEYNIPTQRPTFSGVVNLHNVQCLDSDVNKIVSDLSQLCNVNFTLVGTYNYQNKSMMSIWIRPDTLEFNQIEPHIYAKYGI